MVDGRLAEKHDVERLEGDARNLRNLANPRVVVPAVGENGLGCFDDELALEFLSRPSGTSFGPATATDVPLSCDSSMKTN
jgi:hypothetical protein